MASNDFTYFDQFVDVNLDMNEYLDFVKNETEYEYIFTNIQPTKVTLKNIFDKIEIISTFKEDGLNFDPYIVGENERIEVVSYKKYGAVSYWWVIAIFNNIKNVFTEWCLTQNQLSDLSEKLFQTENKYSKKAYYDMLFERNEIKRRIILPKTTVVNSVVAKFREEFQKTLK